MQIELNGAQPGSAQDLARLPDFRQDKGKQL